MRSRHTTLCYHAISAAWGDPLAVTPEAFEQQMRSLLRRGVRPVDADRALGQEPGTFHVTFDDCYRSITPALALLAELEIPATVFACSALADDGAPLVLPELAGRADGHEAELETLAWDGLAGLVAGGLVEVGSHTVSHAHLPQLDDAALAAELRHSRERIERELGRPCRYVAYPFGESDARVRAAAEAAGYLAGFALAAPPGPPGPFALPRVDVYRATGRLRFRTRTSRLDGPVRAASRALRRGGR